MVIVAPSLLSANFLELQSELNAFKGQQDLWFHLDIMDGHFVPNLTFGPFIIEQIAKGSSIPLDAHLMVNNPAANIERLSKLPLKNVTIHQETTPHLDRLIHQIKSSFPSAGVSLNPATPQEVLPDYILQMVDLVLIMSVNPGFGGQQFIEATYQKILSLHQRRKSLKAHFKIEVDGGVNAENAVQLIKCGADILVAGNFLFSNPQHQYGKLIESLRQP